MTYPFIVAIGASSGGLEEINSFFDYSIKLDASYTIIHHFSKENTSTLVELLSRHSKLMVKDAVDNMRIEPNSVYILPDHHLVTIKDYHFHIKSQHIKSLNEFSIDHFFTSLAFCCKGKAIGIVLSGTGADGISGLKLILFFLLNQSFPCC